MTHKLVETGDIVSDVVKISRISIQEIGIIPTNVVDHFGN